MKRNALCALLVALALVAPAMLLAQTVYPPGVLERYWECMERHDLDAINQLLWYHNNVERIDASIYGLPRDDFDDRQALTIQERLDYRASPAGRAEEMATSGPAQYPHFLRPALDHYYVATGQRVGCTDILVAAGLEPGAAKDLENGWASDLNITSTDPYERGEVNIAVDPASPNRLIATSVPSGLAGENSSYRAVSTDYGQTWARGRVGNSSGSTWECDPVSYYQRSTGRIYHAKMACNNGSCGSWVRGLVRYSTDGGLSFTDCANRPGTSNSEDREWITIDNTPSSPCYGTLYATWHVTNSEKVSRSTDDCGTWTNLASLTGQYQAITPDLNPAADGHAYVMWHNYGSPRSFRLVGSTDCGVTWNAPSSTIIKTKIANVGATSISQCERGIANQVAIDVDRAPSSQFFGRVYAAMFDMNLASCYGASTWTCAQWDTNWSSTCNWDVYLAYSDDLGVTWRKPSDGTVGADNVTAAEGDTVDHILGFMRVDSADGSLYLAYHRSRLAPASAADRQKTNYMVVRSTDGGATWEPPVQASTLEGDERSAGHAPQWERGDYQGLDVYEGVAWPVWIDRRGQTGAGSEEEIITRKLCSEPSHWSERAPTFTTPAVRATGDTTVTVSWDAPDLYWGDGGENPSARKYQLWVDGALAQDNIAWGATSTDYTPGDQLGHTYVVRAVNQCGVSKDYVGVTYGPLIFADGFESGGPGAWSAVVP